MVSRYYFLDKYYSRVSRYFREYTVKLNVKDFNDNFQHELSLFLVFYVCVWQNYYFQASFNIFWFKWYNNTSTLHRRDQPSEQILLSFVQTFYSLNNLQPTLSYFQSAFPSTFIYKIWSSIISSHWKHQIKTHVKKNIVISVISFYQVLVPMFHKWMNSIPSHSHSLSESVVVWERIGSVKVSDTTPLSQWSAGGKQPPLGKLFWCHLAGNGKEINRKKTLMTGDSLRSFLSINVEEL